MKLETKPKNIAHMGNVGTAKEFTMKSTAKSFEILSSSLYSNPIRAIIRELSTNAYDSHIEAGNKNSFDIHLPTSFEPYFYIRDYGVGLTADQVENIYITYFDSNKTDNNDLVGGLGLGSKAPFSYTQNFTVTAIKNGMKSLFSAFINDDGIPAIVKMGEMATNEPSGVEIKFAVEKDFYKFEEEAKFVYTYFGMKPNFVGKGIKIPTIEYETRNVIPNLHVVKGNGYRTRAIAVMGNIPYPIDVPNADKVLGSLLSRYQEYPIQIDFDIGEVQFQASREGLHYTKNTIQAIGRKFKELDDSLYNVFKKEMNTIDNTWLRSVAFHEKVKSNRVWDSPSRRYLTDHPENIANDILIDDNKFKNFNVKLEYYKFDLYSGVVKQQNSIITISPDATVFVENDTNIGLSNRIKYHLKTTKCTKKYYNIVPFDKTVNIDYNGFYSYIKNPPENCKIKASSLEVMPKKDRNYKSTKNVGVLKLVNSETGSHWDVERKYKWEPCMFDSLDKSKTYYYIPLNGYRPIFNAFADYNWTTDAKFVFDHMRKSTISGIYDIDVYGVRKSDIDKIKDFKNWVNLEEYLVETANNIKAETFYSSLIYVLDDYSSYKFTLGVVKLLNDPTSDYIKFTSYVKGAPKLNERYAVEFIQRISPNIDVNGMIKEAHQFVSKNLNKYPLLRHIRTAKVTHNEIAEYVNFIDSKKE